jgi:hypothetical protein
VVNDKKAWGDTKDRGVKTRTQQKNPKKTKINRTFQASGKNTYENVEDAQYGCSALAE